MTEDNLLCKARMRNMQNKMCHLENSANKNKNTVVLQVEEKFYLIKTEITRNRRKKEKIDKNKSTIESSCCGYSKYDGVSVFLHDFGIKLHSRCIDKCEYQ